MREFLNRRGGAALLLVLFCILLFGFDLGGRHISSPDEGRYIEIPREMIATGDYVLPRLDGILYFEKPPLFYWLEAGVISVFGVSEWATRLVPALLGLFGCFCAFYVARRFYGRTAGLVAGGVLATTLLYYALARFIVIDMTVSVFISAALFAFLLSVEETDDKRAIWYARAGHMAAALAVLSKGLIGVLLPGAIGILWILLTGRWRYLRRILCPSGIIIFLAIAVPWHVLAATRNRDFLWFYFLHEQFLRFTTTVHRRYQPIWFFVPVLLAGFLPWTGYLWYAVKRAWPKNWAARATNPVELYLLIWAVVIFIFFSVSDSKLITYILPVFPPLAVLIGGVVAPYLDNTCTDNMPWGRGIFAASFGLLALLVPVALWTPLLQGNEDIAPYLSVVAPIVVPLAIIFALAVIGILILPRLYGMRASIAIIGISTVIGWTGASLVASRIDPNSVKQLALTIKTYEQPGDTVASFGTLFYDLPVYLERKVIVVDNHAEFDFGMTQEDTSAWVVDSAGFWKLWNSGRRVFMLTRQQTFDAWKMRGMPARMCVLGHTDRAVALANAPLARKDGSSACEQWYDAP